jgi:hypothetical protein
MYVFYAIAIMCVFLSSFQAWQDEHRALLLEAKKEEPALSPRVIDKIVGNIHGDPKFHTSYMIRAEIGNSGAPSVAYKWELVFDGHSDVRCDRARIPEPLTLGRDNKPPYIFHSNEALYEKVETEPIRQGAQVRGLLWFWCTAEPNVLRDATGALRFLDVNGKTWSAPILAGPFEETDQYYPGISEKSKP